MRPANIPTDTSGLNTLISLTHTDPNVAFSDNLREREREEERRDAGRRYMEMHGRRNVGERRERESACT